MKNHKLPILILSIALFVLLGGPVVSPVEAQGGIDPQYHCWIESWEICHPAPGCGTFISLVKYECYRQCCEVGGCEPVGYCPRPIGCCPPPPIVLGEGNYQCTSSNPSFPQSLRSIIW